MCRDLKPPSDWDNLSFAYQPAKIMYQDTCAADGQWRGGQTVPFAPLEINPAAGVLNYGQGIFEGMKAQRTKKDRLVIFRPEENARRMARGADRMCLPAYPAEAFVDAVKACVRDNADFVPPYRKGSLYIRPLLIGSGPVLGVAPAPEFTFLIYCNPVGEYFKGGIQPIRLEACTEYHRAAPKGTGDTKTICNYAPTMRPAKETKGRGFSEYLYLDAREDRYIEEVGSANFFCVLDGKLITPGTGSILPGITRKSVMQLAADVLNIPVEERKVSLDEALGASEAFCTGTAAVISPIGAVTKNGSETVFNDFKVGPVTAKIHDLLTGIQVQDEKDQFDWVVEV